MRLRSMEVIRSLLKHTLDSLFTIIGSSSLLTRTRSHLRSILSRRSNSAKLISLTSRLSNLFNLDQIRTYRILIRGRRFKLNNRDTNRLRALLIQHTRILKSRVALFMRTNRIRRLRNTLLNLFFTLYANITRMNNNNSIVRGTRILREFRSLRNTNSLRINMLVHLFINSILAVMRSLTFNKQMMTTSRIRNNKFADAIKTSRTNSKTLLRQREGVVRNNRALRPLNRTLSFGGELFYRSCFPPLSTVDSCSSDASESNFLEVFSSVGILAFRFVCRPEVPSKQGQVAAVDAVTCVDVLVPNEVTTGFTHDDSLDKVVVEPPVDKPSV